MQTKEYDVIIIGAGVTGSALAYVLSKYTSIKSIAIIEKEKKIANVNSKHTQNSQTLHFGDIETNYTLEKAKRVNQAAELIAGYLTKNKNTEEIFSRNHKLVLAIGKTQIEILKNRVKEFKKLFPKIKLISKKEIQKLEPLIIKNRNKNEDIAALYSPDGFAVDFGKLAENFIGQAKKANSKINIFQNHKITKISKQNTFSLSIKNESISKVIKGKIVISCAGSHSLILAQEISLAKELGVLPVAGSFFKTKKKVLNGKCYTLQEKKLPFAAIHGDPEVHYPHQTKFGPTAKVLPLLERRKTKTFWEFLKISTISINGIISLIKILSDPILFKYGIKNTFYDVPILGRWMFTKQIQKIIPSIRYKDIKRAQGYGGIRPQIINTKTKNLQMGEAKIIGEKCIFNITPSPGASVCLKAAQEDTKKIIDWIGNSHIFNESQFLKDHKR